MKVELNISEIGHIVHALKALGGPTNFMPVHSGLMLKMASVYAFANAEEGRKFVAKELAV